MDDTFMCRCQAGRYMLNGECVQCPKNTFNPETGKRSPEDCISCGEIAVTDFPGSTSKVECYCPENSVLVGTACTQCGMGYFYNSHIEILECQQCPEGRYQVQNEHISEVCNECPDGFFCPRGASALTACSGDQLCPAGTAQPFLCCDPNASPQEEQSVCKCLEGYFALPSHFFGDPIWGRIPNWGLNECADIPISERQPVCQQCPPEMDCSEGGMTWDSLIMPTGYWQSPEMFYINWDGDVTTQVAFGGSRRLSVGDVGSSSKLSESSRRTDVGTRRVLGVDSDNDTTTEEATTETATTTSTTATTTDATGGETTEAATTTSTEAETTTSTEAETTTSTTTETATTTSTKAETTTSTNNSGETTEAETTTSTTTTNATSNETTEDNEAELVTIQISLPQIASKALNSMFFVENCIEFFFADCPGNTEWKNWTQCDVGREGPLCANCLKGPNGFDPLYFRGGAGGCVPCGNNSVARFTFVGFVAGLFILLAVSGYHYKKTLHAIEFVGKRATSLRNSLRKSFYEKVFKIDITTLENLKSSANLSDKQLLEKDQNAILFRERDSEITIIGMYLTNTHTITYTQTRSF
jgi:hypothetical protein